MSLKRETIANLGLILKEEFDYEPDGKDLEKFGNSLVRYFDLLAKIEFRYSFGNRSGHHIDKASEKNENKDR